jgi:hypothetical protein
MTAKIIEIRDYKRREETRKLERQAAEIMSQVVTPGSGIDAIPYQAPEKDPA